MAVSAINAIVAIGSSALLLRPSARLMGLPVNGPSLLVR